jgi:transcriptional regulator with XRE-family HTH domain
MTFKLGGHDVNTKQAIAERIIGLCREKKITTNAMANIAGISPSTIYSILNTKSKSPEIITVKKICDGLEISLAEFFDADVFRDLEQEIK